MVVLPVWGESEQSVVSVPKIKPIYAHVWGEENMRIGATDLLETLRSGANRPVAKAYALMAPTGKCGPIL